MDQLKSMEKNRKMLQVQLCGDPAAGGIQITHVSSNINQQEEDCVLANIHYLAEGAANALFRLEPADEETAAEVPEGLLIRLRKGKMGRKASKLQAPPAFAEIAVNLTFLRNEVVPALGFDQIVPFYVVSLAPHVIDIFNNVLHIAEAAGNRSVKRHGWFLLDDQKEALLMENMQPIPDEDAILFDFKPKWLALSPSAPPNSVRCRTCAHNMKTEKPISKRFCPLGLHSDCIWEIRRCVDILLPSLPKGKENWNLEAVRRELTQFFWSEQGGKALLDPLKALQIKYDPHGVIDLISEPQPERPDQIPRVYSKIVQYMREANPEGYPSVAKAMTYRDVSILTKISRIIEENGNQTYKLNAKLADFDVKVMDDTKLKKWVEDELSLITYYKGEEQPKVPPSQEICALNRNLQLEVFLYPNVFSNSFATNT